MNTRQIIRNAEREAAYQYTLALVQLLAQRVDRSRYWYVGGQRCDTLDEAVRELGRAEQEKG